MRQLTTERLSAFLALVYITIALLAVIALCVEWARDGRSFAAVLFAMAAAIKATEAHLLRQIGAQERLTAFLALVYIPVALLAVIALCVEWARDGRSFAVVLFALAAAIKATEAHLLRHIGAQG